MSVRELQQDLRRIIDRVERGEVVEITRRRRPVARLVRASTTPEPAPWPDLDRRAREVFGDRVLSPPPSQQLLSDRDEG